MFTKPKDDPTKTAGAARGEIKLAACAGARAIALIGQEVRLVYAMGAGLPATTIACQLPPGGRVIALDASGPSAITADGTLWLLADSRWQKVGSLFAEVTPW